MLDFWPFFFSHSIFILCNSFLWSFPIWFEYLFFDNFNFVEKVCEGQGEDGFGGQDEYDARDQSRDPF